MPLGVPRKEERSIALPPHPDLAVPGEGGAADGGERVRGRPRLQAAPEVGTLGAQCPSGRALAAHVPRPGSCRDSELSSGGDSKQTGSLSLREVSRPSSASSRPRPGTPGAGGAQGRGLWARRRPQQEKRPGKPGVRPTLAARRCPQVPVLPDSTGARPPSRPLHRQGEPPGLGTLVLRVWWRSGHLAGRPCVPRPQSAGRGGGCTSAKGARQGPAVCGHRPGVMVSPGSHEGLSLRRLPQFPHRPVGGINASVSSGTRSGCGQTGPLPPPGVRQPCSGGRASWPPGRRLRGQAGQLTGPRGPGRVTSGAPKACP